MRTNLTRMTAVAAILFASLFWLSCGDTYRPVITPLPQPGGDPQGASRAIVLATGGTTQPGATNNIDVSGDTDVGNVYVGEDPVMIALSGTSAYVVNHGSRNLTLYSTFFTSGNPTTITLTQTASPVFAAITSGDVYVADPANNAVDVVSNGNVTTGSIAVGTNPVALAGTPDGTKLYVVNQGSDSVSVITTTDNLKQFDIPLMAGAAPSYAIATPDSKWIFVAESGTGKIAIISTADGSVTEVDATTPANAAAGPSYMKFDNTLKRVYVANTAGNSISIFDETGTMPALLATVAVGTAPTSVAPLSDGSRAYVANQGSGTVSVVDVKSFTKTKDIAVAAAGEQVMWVAASSDATKVYAAVKGPNDTSDPGFTAVIPTATDAILTKIPPPRIDPNCTPATSPVPCTYTQPIMVVTTP